MIDEVIRQAAALESQGRADAAAKLLSDTLSDNPQAQLLRYQLIMLFVRQGNWKDAERLARSAGPDFANAYARTLGEIFANVGAFGEAEECLRRALDANTRDAVALTCLGSVYVHQKKLAQGLACVDAALAIAPEFRAALNIRQSVVFLLESAKNARATHEEYARRNGLDMATVNSADIEFPCALANDTGAPRFTLSLPGSLIINDLGAAILFREEVSGRGWEFPLRKFFGYAVAFGRCLY